MAKLLLVDDNRDLLVLYSSLLREAGHEVVVAEGGLAALDYLDQHVDDQPDLVLLDMEMPEIDGLETARRLRDRGPFHGLCVIALTSHELPEQVAEGLDAGCDGYITKPAVPQDLLDELAIILAGQQGA